MQLRHGRKANETAEDTHVMAETTQVTVLFLFFFLYKEARRYEEGKYVIVFISETVDNFFYFEC
jgi:hypothetical protein